MTTCSTDSVIIIDQQAEGLPSAERDAREPVSPQQTMMIPSARPHLLRRDPVAETGVVAAVVLSGEGSDDRDTQDALRTAAETQTAPQAERQNGHKLSALIVEDTLELAEILQVTLQRMHLVTAHESHGSRALARFNEMNPDVVLLDIGLPDSTGWKVLERIKERQRETGGKMPIVIVITGYGDAANRLVGKLHGVYSYLVKPFTSNEVEGAVRSALSSAAG
jgi:CheY-like chemotaxis protein